MNNLDPLNAAGLAINGAMLLCIVVIIVLGKLSARKRRKSGQALTLLKDGRACWAFCLRIRAATPGSTITLPALTHDDHL